MVSTCPPESLLQPVLLLCNICRWSPPAAEQAIKVKSVGCVCMWGGRLRPASADSVHQWNIRSSSQSCSYISVVWNIRSSGQKISVVWGLGRGGEDEGDMAKPSPLIQTRQGGGSWVMDADDVPGPCTASIGGCPQLSRSKLPQEGAHKALVPAIDRGRDAATKVWMYVQSTL